MLNKFRDNYLIFTVTVLKLSNCLIVCSEYIGFPFPKAKFWINGLA